MSPTAAIFRWALTVLVVALVLPGRPRSLTSQQLPADTVVVVEGLELDQARPGRNPLRARIRSVADTTILVVMDLRAVPGMWMGPNVQLQYPTELESGQESVLEGVYEFAQISPEATLRVTVGPGRYMEEYGTHVVRRADFRKTFRVGRGNPHALDLTETFTTVRRGPLEIWAWNGSPAQARLDEIAARRLEGLRVVEGLLGVEAPDSIRLVFYGDHETKRAHTGHRGTGLARGNTLVEVYNDSVQMDPYHELAHVVAAGAGAPPPLLSEGFAIWASERLGADALEFLGFPEQRVDEVVCGVRGTPDYVPLDRLLTLENIGTDPDRAGREYAEAGSFLKYLTETGGMERFREAYRSLEAGAELGENRARLERLYGRSLQELEAGWHAAVGEACPSSGP